MANELPVWNNAWLPRKYPAVEPPIYDDIWNPEIDGKKIGAGDDGGRAGSFRPCGKR